jgi:hypothetical protein
LHARFGVAISAFANQLAIGLVVDRELAMFFPRVTVFILDDQTQEKHVRIAETAFINWCVFELCKDKVEALRPILLWIV